MARLPDTDTLGDLGFDFSAMFAQATDYAKKAGAEAIQASVQKRIAATQAKTAELRAQAAATQAALAAPQAAPAAAPAAGVAMNWGSLWKPAALLGGVAGVAYVASRRQGA